MEAETNYSNTSYNPPRNYSIDSRKYMAKRQSGEGYGTGAADQKVLEF